MKLLRQILLPATVMVGIAANGPGRTEPRAAAVQIEFVAEPGSPVSVGPMAGRPAVGDCNGDGNPDIVIACGTC